MVEPSQFRTPVSITKAAGKLYCMEPDIEAGTRTSMKHRRVVNPIPSTILPRLSLSPF